MKPSEALKFALKLGSGKQCSLVASGGQKY